MTQAPTATELDPVFVAIAAFESANAACDTSPYRHTQLSDPSYDEAKAALDRLAEERSLALSALLATSPTTLAGAIAAFETVGKHPGGYLCEEANDIKRGAVDAFLLQLAEALRKCRTPQSAGLKGGESDGHKISPAASDKPNMILLNITIPPHFS